MLEIIIMIYLTKNQANYTVPTESIKFESFWFIYPIFFTQPLPLLLPSFTLLLSWIYFGLIGLFRSCELVERYTKYKKEIILRFNFSL